MSKALRRLLKEAKNRSGGSQYEAPRRKGAELDRSKVRLVAGEISRVLQKLEQLNGEVESFGDGFKSEQARLEKAIDLLVNIPEELIDSLTAQTP